MRRPAVRLALYAAGIEAVTWAGLVPVMLSRRARGRLAPGVLGERLGRAPGRVASGQRVVVHAVSLGELAAARGLLALLAASIPGAPVTLTVGTEAAREVAVGLVGQFHVDSVQYLPWDRPRAIRRWLSALDPSLVVVLETELWPGLLDACHALGVPVALVSTRVYPRDVARYRVIRGFLAPLLERVALVAAQSEEERDRLIAIGAPGGRTIVTGDLKAVAALGSAPLPPRIAPVIEGARRLIVGGSTHTPEEQWLLAAFAAARRSHPDIRLAVAPRSVGRASRLVQIVEAAGFTGTTTKTATRNDWDVLVVDEPGLLAGLYPHAAIAVVGGTFATHGGHSLLEAAAAGVPIVCGPHIAHVAAQVRRFADAGALVRADAGTLAERLGELLAEPTRGRAIGTRARDVVVAMAEEAAQVRTHLADLPARTATAHTSERVAV